MDRRGRNRSETNKPPRPRLQNMSVVSEDFAHHYDLMVPMPTKRIADVVMASLAADEELRPEMCKRTMSVSVDSWRLKCKHLSQTYTVSSIFCQ